MKKRRIVFGFLGGLAIASTLASVLMHHHHGGNKADTQLPKTLVVLKPVTITTVPVVITATGNLVANQQADIDPEISGYIQKIHFTEGNYVKKDTVLVQLDARAQQDKVEQAQAAAKLSRDNYKRNLQLKKSLYISAQDLDKLKSQADQDQATLNNANTILSEMTLRAPFNGYLGSRNLSVGDYVQAGTKIIELTDLHNVKIRYQVPARYVDQLHLRQPVSVETNTTDQETMMGKVSYISPIIVS